MIDLNTNAVTATISVGKLNQLAGGQPSGRARLRLDQPRGVGDRHRNQRRDRHHRYRVLGLGIAATESYAYATVSYNAKVVVIDSSTNAVTATISAGPDHLRGIAVDPNGTRAYASMVTRIFRSLTPPPIRSLRLMTSATETAWGWQWTPPETSCS